MEGRNGHDEGLYGLEVVGAARSFYTVSEIINLRSGFWQHGRISVSTFYE